MKKLSEAFQVLKAFVVPTLWILFWMTALRAFLFFAVFYQDLDFHADLFSAFFAGFRFDLLILGFFWIPVVVLTWSLALLFSPVRLLWFWKVYFALMILVIFDSALFDLFWSSIHFERLEPKFWSYQLSHVLNAGWEVLGPRKFLMSTLGMGFSSLALMLMMYRVPKPRPVHSETNFSFGRLAFQMFISVFLVAFAARGTWTAHHLNREHSVVSDQPLVNQLALNPLWNLVQ